MYHTGQRRSKPSNQTIQEKQTTLRLSGRGEKNKSVPFYPQAYWFLSLLFPMSSFLVWVEAVEVEVLDVKPAELRLKQLLGLCPWISGAWAPICKRRVCQPWQIFPDVPSLTVAPGNLAASAISHSTRRFQKQELSREGTTLEMPVSFVFFNHNLK